MFKNSIKLIFILLLLNIVTICVAEDFDVVRKANEQYTQGNYEEAIKLYEQVLAGGKESAELYYNLGNSYYKSNKFTYSILYFEKAKKLNPRDEDILANLKLVTEYHVVDEIEAVPEFFFYIWFKNLLTIFTCDGWAYISVGSFLLCLIGVGIFGFTGSLKLKKIAFTMASILLIISALSFVFTAKQRSFQLQHNEAIIFTPSVVVKSSPDEKGKDLFPLHEGTKVIIKDALGQWCEIRVASGNVGWLLLSDLKRI
jgi:tetratricopeptide (TPR) repeat protein